MRITKESALNWKVLTSFFYESMKWYTSQNQASKLKVLQIKSTMHWLRAAAAANKLTPSVQNAVSSYFRRRRSLLLFSAQFGLLEGTASQSSL